MITIEKSDPTSAESQRLIAQLSAVLAAITGDEGKGHFSSDTLSAPRVMGAGSQSSRRRHWLWCDQAAFGIHR